MGENRRKSGSLVFGGFDGFMKLYSLKELLWNTGKVGF